MGSLRYFDANNRQNTLFFNPFFNYKLPIGKKIGFIFEFGDKITFITNNLEVLSGLNGSFYISRKIIHKELENTIYIRPGVYFDISPKFTWTLNYLS